LLALAVRLTIGASCLVRGWRTDSDRSVKSANCPDFINGFAGGARKKTPIVHQKFAWSGFRNS
jgi:hypothetical protein